MRVFGDFSSFDLAQITGASKENIKWYLWVLKRAGYIRVVGKDGRYEIYRLIKNTGRQAVVLKSKSEVWDPNNGQIWRDDG